MEKGGIFLVRFVIIYFILVLGSLYFLNWYIGEPEIDLAMAEADTKIADEVLVPTQTPKPKDKSVARAEEVAKHNTPSDCWMIFENHIYNITPYFGSHPGGNAVMSPYCGKDATTAFNSKNESPARAHSGSARELLLRYLIQ